jgi:hypothetical protein
VVGMGSVMARRRIPVRCGKWRSGAGRHLAAALYETTNESPRQVSHVLPFRKIWEARATKNAAKYLKLLATPAGFEPATFSLEGCCSIP